MTISELISLISKTNINSSKEQDDIIYNSQELLEKYPMFSKYTLDVAIKKKIYLFLESDIKDILKSLQ